MDEKIILGSMALDLKRAAIGFHRGSVAMAERFFTEALKRKKEYKQEKINPYLTWLFIKIENLKTLSKEKLAEDALMYSTLIQNYVICRL